MRTRIEEAGEDVFVRIPRGLAEEAGIEPGSEVDLAVREGGLLIRPARRKRIRFEALLRAITRKRRGEGEPDDSAEPEA